MEKKIIEELNWAFERSTRDCKDREINDSLFLPNLLFFCKNNLDLANEIVEKWSKENDVNFLVIDGNDQSVIRKATEMVTIGHLTKDYIAPTKEQIEKLNKPKTILFLKNLDKMEDEIYRRWLFNLMNELIVADNTKEDGFVFVKNLLFVVATVGEMQGRDVFEMGTMDAKDAFMYIDINE